MAFCWQLRCYWAGLYLGFIPAQDKEYLISFVQLLAGASLSRTDRVLEKMNEIARSEPEYLPHLLMLDCL
jgi:multidrug efflux pump subunit AcrB